MIKCKKCIINPINPIIVNVNVKIFKGGIKGIKGRILHWQRAYHVLSEM